MRCADQCTHSWRQRAVKDGTATYLRNRFRRRLKYAVGRIWQNQTNPRQRICEVSRLFQRDVRLWRKKGQKNKGRRRREQGKGRRNVESWEVK